MEQDFKIAYETENKINITNSLFEWMEDLIVPTVITMLIFTFFLRVITVDGDSMHPNYIDGDNLLVSGIVTEVKQGDIVIITNVMRGEIIKRVIAVEGQVVDIDAERACVVIDGIPLDDSQYGLQKGMTYPYNPEANSSLKFPLTVPDDCIFVLGDNRRQSRDSRAAEIGMINKKNIIGKALIYVYPFKKIGPVK